jgi:nucleoid-associated protein YgaU
MLRLALGLLLAAALIAVAFGLDLTGNPLPEGSVLDSTSSPRPRGTAQETVRPLKTYIVREGDTLRSIAHQFYGSELGWRRIYNRNRDRLADPGSLRVGQLLIIPQD